MPVTRTQVMNEILVEAAHDSEARYATKVFAERVKEYWKSIAPKPGDPDHPYATGTYRKSIKRRSKRGANIGRIPYYRHWVGTNDPVAAHLEYGTGPDVLGVGMWWGLDGRRHRSAKTPTEAFAFAARTALRFGGTPD